MKKPTIAMLLKKIEALEKEVAELKAAPREQHTHFHTYPADPARLPWAPPQQPYIVPQPYAVPYWGHGPNTMPVVTWCGTGDVPNMSLTAHYQSPEDNAGGVLARAR